MGLFNNILGGLEVVAGGVLDYFSYGLAGNTLIAEGLLTLGKENLGGSVGKFLNSGWGTGLQLAVGLGSAAYGMLGNATVAGAGEANATTSGFLQASGTDQQTLQALQSGADAGALADSPTAINLANTTVDQATAANSARTGGVAGAAPTSADSAGQLTANSAQAATAQTAQAQVATGAGAGTDATAATPIQQLQPVGSGVTNPAIPADVTGSVNDAANAAASGGMLSKAGAYLQKNPMVAMMAGQTVAGLGEGLANEAAMNKEIAAQQYFNKQWDQGVNPSSVAAMQASAAAPITVPAGYLSRAQAVKNLMQGNTSQTGPVVGVQPGQPNTPTQVTPPPTVMGPLALNPATPAGATQATVAAPRGGVA